MHLGLSHASFPWRNHRPERMVRAAFITLYGEMVALFSSWSFRPPSASLETSRESAC